MCGLDIILQYTAIELKHKKKLSLEATAYKIIR